MRELGLAGLVAILFGLGSYYATRDLGIFSAVNLSLGALALLVAIAAGAWRLRLVGGPHTRPVIGRGLLGIALALALGVALERGAARLDVHLDWTFEQRFEPADAMRQRLGELSAPVSAYFYFDVYDPRARRTRLLLKELAQLSGGQLEVHERQLDEHPDEADRYAVATSNTVVLLQGDRWERADRPTEGALFEALYRLTSSGAGTVLLLRGEGEGDPERGDALGYSGLAEALITEGYEVGSVVAAALREVPEGTAAVMVLAPQRRLLPHALDALRRYLARGGRLLALLEPGRESGVEEILAEYGLRSPNALVVDPASGPVRVGGIEGLDVIAYNYEVEPTTRNLDANRMTFFPGVRSFELRKPRVEDDVRRLVLSSPRSWLTDDLSWLERTTGRPEPEAEPQGYQTLAASGRYQRDGEQTRIVAFGDADFASNRYLRALYNLDLILNASHWVTENEPAITLRPKVREAVQFPVPLNSSVQALYGVGLLLPELMLIAGGIVWLRRRSA